jgi:putative DNA primase/helicase
VDDHKNAELRGLLTPLKSWASRNNVAVIFNTHVNKPQGAKVVAMMRVMGSVAWVNAVRSAHMFSKDPEDHTRRLFVGMKTNIGKERKGLAYRIAETETLARIEWLGEVDTTADEAVNREKRKRDVRAAEWLEELFQGLDRMPSKVIYAEMEDKTKLSADALREAKDLMGIRAFQDRDEEGRKCWFWVWTSEDRERWRVRKASQPASGGANEAPF